MDPSAVLSLRKGRYHWVCNSTKVKFKIAVKRFLVYSEFILLLKMCAWSSGGYKDATKWEDEVGKGGRRGVSWIKRGGLGVPYIPPPDVLHVLSESVWTLHVLHQKQMSRTSCPTLLVPFYSLLAFLVSSIRRNLRLINAILSHRWFSLFSLPKCWTIERLFQGEAGSRSFKIIRVSCTC